MPLVDVETEEERAAKLELYRRRAYIAWAVIGLGVILFAIYKLCGTFMPAISIILLTADNIEGPYLYQAPVVMSGFHTGSAYKDSDL